MNRVGVDLVEIKRIEAAVDAWGEPFLSRVFTVSELELCRGKSPSLAARFAAKEAVMKALGTGFRGAGWSEIEVLADSHGQPVVNLRGRAKKLADELGIKELAVSLSHSDHLAIAYVHASCP